MQLGIRFLSDKLGPVVIKESCGERVALMGAPAESIVIVGPATGRQSTVQDVDRAEVLQELETILASPPFRSSSRSKQFLSYVVRHRLEGHDGLLKERSIGSDLFHRPPDYATGDDPVVRVQAGEVRRRLEQYQRDFSTGSSVRIELPVGSYVPVFHRNPVPNPIEVPSEALVRPRPAKRKLLAWKLLGTCVILGAIAVGLGVRSKISRKSVLDQFWAPIFATSQPLLICVPKPILYRPSITLYERYAKDHPGSFQNEVERLNEPLPLPSNEKIVWGDMLAFPDFGLGAGDVYAAFRLASLLGRMNKPTQLRIGDGSSFDDLRNSPALMIGAFSNRWTLEMTSNLRFQFAEDNGIFWIQDSTVPDKKWFCRLGKHREVIEDFGLVTRLLDSKTGQVAITVGGITAPGSDAAAQFISNPEYLADGLRTAPPDWQKKNMEVVVETTVVDGVAGSPHAVAAYFW
jgi:hypothetical protein